MSAFKSTMFAGGKPYFSRNVSGFMTTGPVLERSKTVVRSLTSCKISRSPVSTTHSQSAASQRFAIVPIRSSASNPASS